MESRLRYITIWPQKKRDLFVFPSVLKGLKRLAGWLSEATSPVDERIEICMLEGCWNHVSDVPKFAGMQQLTGFRESG
jgi:hypothetical protein